MNSGAAILKSLAMVPAVVSGFWFAQQRPSFLFHEKKVPLSTSLVHGPKQAPAGPANEDVSELIIERKLRIEFLLNTLERVAEVSQEMAPERAAALEPAIADLMEQLLDLSSASSLVNPDTDSVLTQLEATVQELLDSLAKAVEPETSL
jgi:hypothetical protein